MVTVSDEVADTPGYNTYCYAYKKTTETVACRSWGIFINLVRKVIQSRNTNRIVKVL